jgi:hypothetical protein
MTHKIILGVIDRNVRDVRDKMRQYHLGGTLLDTGLSLFFSARRRDCC